MAGPFFNKFGQTEKYLYEGVFGDEYRDRTAEALFHEAYFVRGQDDPERVAAIREALSDYMMQEYGIDFERDFDWETWRETYESQGA